MAVEPRVAAEPKETAARRIHTRTPIARIRRHPRVFISSVRLDDGTRWVLEPAGRGVVRAVEDGAEIAKMMTRLTHRNRGVATALLRAAQQLAIAHGRTLLVLDTAEEDGAAPLYEKMGFQLSGLIPDYALKPHGGLTGTLIYWKRIGAAT